MMLVIALTLIGAFILMSVLTEGDDDEGPGGGTMVPITVPN